MTPGLVGLLAAATVAEAEIICGSSIPSVTSETVVVPDRRSCNIGNVVVGNLRVGEGATLRVMAPVQVTGNFSAISCRKINVFPATGAISVLGNFFVRDCSEGISASYASNKNILTVYGNSDVSHNGSVQIGASEFHGFVKFNRNNGAANAFLVGNTVFHGNVQILNTTGAAALSKDTFEANLSCTGNGVIDDRGGNTAFKSSGQCSSITPAP